MWKSVTGSGTRIFQALEAHVSQEHSGNLGSLSCPQEAVWKEAHRDSSPSSWLFSRGLLGIILEETRDSELWFSKYLRWCSGRADWEGQGMMKVERGEAGGGIGMRNTCKSMADSCQCTAKNTTIL